MKKSSGLTVIFLAIASILTIFFGRRYAARQEGEMLDNSLYAQNGLNDSEENNEEPAENENESDSQGESNTDYLAEYESRLDSLSLIETLHYSVLSNGDATLAYYGDIDTSQAWYSDLNEWIHNETDQGVTIEEVTYAELDTYELFIQQTTPNVIETNPDVVIYGMPALADKIRDMGVSETDQFLTNILNTLSESLPDAEIVLLEPHPYPSEMNNLNSRSLDYRTYMNTMNEVAAEYDLPVLNVHGQFLAAAEEAGTELSSLFQEDQLTLNETGIDLYMDVLSQELTSPLQEVEE